MLRWRSQGKFGGFGQSKGAMRGVQRLGEAGVVAASWDFGGRTISTQMLGLVCLAPEACF